jgi:hypothetical protein
MLRRIEKNAGMEDFIADVLVSARWRWQVGRPSQPQALHEVQNLIATPESCITPSSCFCA